MHLDILPQGSRKVPGFQGLYAHPDGILWRECLHGGYKQLHPYHNAKTGAWNVNIKNARGTWTAHSIHRLIAKTFCKQEFMCTRVMALDGNYNNARASNLKWVTPSEQLKTTYARKSNPTHPPAHQEVAPACK